MQNKPAQLSSCQQERNLFDWDAARLTRIGDEIRKDGGEFVDAVADVCEEDTVIGFLKAAHDKWGKIDLLVNSAGRDSLAPPVTDVTLEEWNKTIGPNLTAVFLTCREAFRYMEKQASGGRIINLGSSSTKVASLSKTTFTGPCAKSASSSTNPSAAKKPPPS